MTNSTKYSVAALDSKVVNTTTIQKQLAAKGYNLQQAIVRLSTTASGNQNGELNLEITSYLPPVHCSFVGLESSFWQLDGRYEVAKYAVDNQRVARGSWAGFHVPMSITLKYQPQIYRYIKEPCGKWVYLLSRANGFCAVAEIKPQTCLASGHADDPYTATCTPAKGFKADTGTSMVTYKTSQVVWLTEPKVAAIPTNPGITLTNFRQVTSKSAAFQVDLQYSILSPPFPSLHNVWSKLIWRGQAKGYSTWKSIQLYLTKARS